LHGFQLWINLPQRDKMIKPRFQDIPSSKIPVAQTKDGTVKAKVIAGEALGTHAIIETRTPILYVHFTLQPKVVQPIPKEYNAFAYVINGKGMFGPAGNQKAAKAGQVVIYCEFFYVRKIKLFCAYLNGKIKCTLAQKI
jgi:redox-sensitive bicupin YhaK (pirin superfamily)